VLWIELPPGKDSVLVQQLAFEAKIGIAPGPLFSSRNFYRNYIRINCGNYLDEAAHDALARLGRIVHCS
jgi:DNA-binding transcriptional MocR family regulator